MYKAFLKPILFLFGAERAHNLASFFLKYSHHWFLKPFFSLFISESPSRPIELMGINFPSRLGLAAGFDKNAEMFKGLGNLGFGFVEVGTVTPKPQPGNDKPRMFRLPQDSALINRMGFNNHGLNSMIKRLSKRNSELIVGGNIGKNKITPNEKAYYDYALSFKQLHPFVDYFVVNVSSPNTPNLRELQDKEPLKKLLSGLQEMNAEFRSPKPILLKIAPDLNNDELKDIIEIIESTQIEGVIATNTTIDRSALKTDAHLINEIGPGGLSGEPLKKRSLEVVKFLRDNMKKNFVIIGVGGIMRGKDAVEMLESGADLIQIYTGFIYGGPNIISEINNAVYEAGF